LRLLVAALVVFVLVSADVVAGGALTRLDRRVSDWARSTGLPGPGWRRPWQRELDQLVNFGDRELVGAVIVVAFAVICWRARTLLPYVRLAVLGAVTIVVVVSSKVAFGREAPPDVQNHDLFRSYPSGHTITAIVLWGLLAAVAAEHPRAGVSPAVARLLSWLAPLLTMVGMVLRDYHWLSDLIGGAALGVVLVQAERLALRHWRGARRGSVAAGGRPAAVDHAASGGPGRRG
jgi:undecaprenyl-diphosphatase